MKYRPSFYRNVFITGSGLFMPGKAVNNDEIDDYIAPINRLSARIKKRILSENGIKQRHYAIDSNGKTQYSAVQMASQAIQQTLHQSGRDLEDISLLATASAGGDLLMPGLANMLQGELRAAPMETRSHHGICAAGVHALKDVANLIDQGGHQNALVAAVEQPSQLFKKSRFEPLSYQIDFDAHFLRWMLSDGAGALSVSSTPQSSSPIALRVDWIHSKSFSGDFPVCMQMGMGKSNQSFLDFPSFADAEAQGKLLLRQDIRLLPQLFEVAVHEYSALVKRELIHPDKVDHFLCHYSSERLGEQTDEIMQKAGLAIERNKWFSNLVNRGNTGSASIFIMLADLWQNRKLKPGEKIFCFVPESGRFTVSFFLLTVVESTTDHKILPFQDTIISPPHTADSGRNHLEQNTLRELADIWHEYRSTIWRSKLVGRILDEKLSLTEYQQWMQNWIPQVREGSKWMREAVHHLPSELQPLKLLIETHSQQEQDDYQILYDDYLAAGGTKLLAEMRRNPGGEALNAYMYGLARSENNLGLLGGIYIIEGTGQRIIPVLLPKLRKQLDLTERGFRFLRYHGENDIAHLQRWLEALSISLKIVPQAAKEIVNTARQVAQLYQLQWEFVL